MNWKCILAGTAMAVMLAPQMAAAQGIGDVENARAKDRQGSYLSRQDRENLHRYGGNDDYGPALRVWLVRVWRWLLRRLLRVRLRLRARA